MFNTDFLPSRTVINFDKVSTSVKSSLVASRYNLLAHINLAVDDVLLINVAIPDTD